MIILFFQTFGLILHLQCYFSASTSHDIELLGCRAGHACPFIHDRSKLSGAINAPQPTDHHQSVGNTTT